MSDSEETFNGPERIALIKLIAAKTARQVRIREDITLKTSWACLWLADKERLRVISELPNFVLLVTLEMLEDAKIVQRWTQREQSAWSKANSEATSLANPAAASVAHSREGTPPPVSSSNVAYTPAQPSPIPPPNTQHLTRNPQGSG